MLLSNPLASTFFSAFRQVFQQHPDQLLLIYVHTAALKLR